jgi:uncharacterized membrane protein
MKTDNRIRDRVAADDQRHSYHSKQCAMDKMIVIVFNREPTAYAAFHALKELHAEGSISLFSAVVITKALNGKLAAKQVGNPAHLPSALSLATDALVVALGGTRIAAIGSPEMPSGAISVANIGVSDEFLDEIARHLRPGKSAVIAEIEEDWVTPLDTIIELLGGVTLRRAHAEFTDAQLEREAAVLRADAEQLRYELGRVEGTAKTKLQAKADAAISRLEAARDMAKQRVRAMALEAEEKIRRMQAQVASVADNERANIERRIFDVQADYQKRSNRIGRAWQLTSDVSGH